MASPPDGRPRGFTALLRAEPRTLGFGFLHAFAFVGFACARIAGSLIGGPAIDRWGARVLLPLHLVPLGVGVAVLALGAGPWSIALYMLLAGLGAGASGTLVTALVAELVPPSRLGAVRSALAALMVVSTAIGPAAYGWLYAWGVTVPAVLWGSLVALAAAAVFAAASPAVRERRWRGAATVRGESCSARLQVT